MKGCDVEIYLCCCEGMDPINERRIMNILNEECAPDGNRDVPQYFVVSPKLLPRLMHSPHSTAHIIFNGPWVSDQDGLCASVLF